MAENEAMNFFNYYASPTKHLTLVTFVGTGHFMMASIFVESILSSSPVEVLCKCERYSYCI
jgi:hypothetical protein